MAMTNDGHLKYVTTTMRCTDSAENSQQCCKRYSELKAAFMDFLCDIDMDICGLSPIRDTYCPSIGRNPQFT